METRSHYIALAGLELRDPPTSVSQVLGAKACTTMLVQSCNLKCTPKSTLLRHGRAEVSAAANSFSEEGSEMRSVEETCPPWVILEKVGR